MISIKYDANADAAYIKLSTAKIKDSDSFEVEGVIPFGSINVDFDEDNKIVGMEVLDASSYLSKEILK